MQQAANQSSGQQNLTTVSSAQENKFTNANASHGVGKDGWAKISFIKISNSINQSMPSLLNLELKSNRTFLASWIWKDNFFECLSRLHKSRHYALFLL
jgi:hypothetical protein